MQKYRKGDVLLVHFPFEENKSITKLRPAILVEDPVNDFYVVKCTKTDKSMRKPCIEISPGTEEFKKMRLKERTFISVTEEVCLTANDIERLIGVCPSSIMTEIENLRK